MDRQAVFQGWPSPGRAWLVASLLLVAYVLSFIDRQILNLLAEPIKQDLALSDLEISFVQGPAFVASYILTSFPLGRMTDLVNRTRLLAIGLGFWTFVTMACGFCRSAVQLSFARAGVGIGEATLTPTAWSLLADSFPPQKRAAPVSIFLMGPYLGAGLAMLFGAKILETFTGTVTITGVALEPWQLCFILVSTPGLVLAFALALLKEPKRILAPGEDPGKRSLKDFLLIIRRRWRIYSALWFGTGLLAVMLYGLQAWTPTYLIRVHGWNISRAGFNYGLVALFAGSLGVLTGPVIQRKLSTRSGKDHSLTIGLTCAASLSVMGLLMTIADGPMVLPLIALLSFAVTIPFAPMATSLQWVTPNYFRGLVAGIYVVTTNILGLGFGPTFVAYLTDKVFTEPTSIGLSMSVLFVVFGVLSAGFYLLGLKDFIRDMRQRQD